MPRVSVIISTYNGERYLAAAVESILDQTFRDFELIVINDGSTDNTLRILEGFQDARLKVFSNPRNLGIAASQNKAVSLATGEYVALMDHDDISLPQRLQVQVQYLDQRAEVSMLGSAVYLIDEQGTVKSLEVYPADDITLKWRLLLFACPFFHISLMIRRAVLEQIAFDEGKYYSGNYSYAGDYELISRIAATHSVANLTEPLVQWRVHHSSTSQRRADMLAVEAMNISRLNVQELLERDELNEFTWTSLQALVMKCVGSAANLSQEQARAAVSFLLLLQRRFYRRYDFPALIVRQHRQRLYWLWGKHFLALAVQPNGSRDMRCRLTLLHWTCKLLLAALLTAEVTLPGQLAEQEPAVRGAFEPGDITKVR